MNTIHLPPSPRWRRWLGRDYRRHWLTRRGYDVQPPVTGHPLGGLCPYCREVDEIAVNGAYVPGEDEHDPVIDGPTTPA